MKNELYTELLWDSFLTALIFTVQDEFMLATMSSFDEYDPLTMGVLALAASLLGYSVNWFIGKLLMHEPWISAHLKQGYDRFCHYANRYGKYLLLFVWIDVYGTFIPFFAGMFKIRLRTMLWISAVGKGAYYIFAFQTGYFTVQN